MINKFKYIKQKIKQLPLIYKLNQFPAMPIIWWGLLVALLPFLFSLLSVPIVWRVGLLFFVINSVVSYHVGKLIVTLRVKHYWLLFLPVVFCLVVLIKFANYNLLFSLIYLIFEVFGLMDKHIYN
ncbi:hypothetical protein OZY43_04485 [Lactobacillus sp. ESL0785]|uniref:hypothetical protein n=1 Tax=Lactobacillus sp. ESL0785 TaxID=2983232 RepID=UPI0023F800FC|nr:hypothetical protein [Lactobacillus sp. ESL0785]WEV70219.1 hypothetical protein OZY43_04485 [Lactobacillus sp. ESL0785]